MVVDGIESYRRFELNENANGAQSIFFQFAMLVPADQTKTHLHTLSLVAKRLADKTICRRLRAAQSDEELYQIITDTEGTPDEA